MSESAPVSPEGPQQPCCAHGRVEHRQEDFTYDGPDVPNPDPTSPHVGLLHGATLTRDWWECRDCKTPFVPQPRRPSRSAGSELDAIAEELRALANEYAPKVGYLVLADKLNRIAATVRSAALSGDREDSERLNFLENSRRGMEYLTCDDQDGEPTRHFWMVDDVLPDKYRVTLREAIDAARSTPAAQET